MKNTSIKNLPLMDRPREKLRYQGASAVSDAELLAILVGSGNRFLPVMKICESLLGKLDYDLQRLPAMCIEDLCRVKGVGEVTAVTLLAALELAARINQPRSNEFKSEAEIAALVRPYFADREERIYMLVLLSENKTLLATCELLLDAQQLPNMEHLLKIISESGAPCLALAINHQQKRTSGPKEEDFLRNIFPAAVQMLGIKLECVLIVGKNGLLNYHKINRRSSGHV